MSAHVLTGLRALYVGKPTLFPQELVNDLVILGNGNWLSDGELGFWYFVHALRGCVVGLSGGKKAEWDDASFRSGGDKTDWVGHGHRRAFANSAAVVRFRTQVRTRTWTDGTQVRS